MSLMMKSILLGFTALALLAAASACAPFKALNVLSATGSYEKHADIAYGSDPRQQLDVYVPLKRQGAAPVVVFFYGGSWNTGSRADYAFVGAALASRGMVAIVADYRLYPQVRYPSFVQDAAGAVAWAYRQAARFGGDPRRVFVMGHSAGAYNAAMVALDARWLGEYGLAPSQLRGWIGLAGPYDFIPIKNEDVRPVFFHPNTPPESQPINHVSRAAPPALLIAPKDDDLVNPVRNTGGLAERLRAQDVPVRQEYFARVSHPSLIATLSWPLRGLAPTLDRIEEFVATTGPRAVMPTAMHATE
jgi:acetyl esterase/lipase